MLRPAAAAFALAIFANACTCGTSAPSKVFVCSTGDECADGYVCDQATKTCVSKGAGGGSGGSGGGVAGGQGGGAIGGGAGGGDPGGGAGGGTGGGDPDGGVGGGSAGGGGGAGGPPDRVVFLTPAQPMYTLTCSPALTVQLRSDAATPTNAVTPVTVTFGPAQIGYFSDAACTIGIAGAQIPAGQSTATVYFSSPSVGTFQQSVSATGLLGATQAQSFSQKPTGIALSVLGAGQLQAGSCFSATLQVRNGLAATPVNALTTFPFAATPADGLRVHPDAACAQPAQTSVSLPAGQSSASFYFKAITGGTVTATFTSPWGNAAQTFNNIVSAVRRGNCSFLNINGNVDCMFNPSLANENRAAVFAQISTSADDPDYALASCALNGDNRVRCRREANFGGATFNMNANVHWQTFELPALNVRHVTNGCNNPPQTVTLLQTVVPANSFVLKQLTSTGTNYGDQELSTAELRSGSQLVWDNGTGACNGSAFDIQVVELSGISVVRGVADAGLGAVTGLPSAGNNRVVFAQPRGNNVVAPVCSRLIRAEAATPTGLTFSRGAGLTDGGCQDPVLTDVVWERIDFGTRATVQTFTTTLGAGVALLDVPVAAVDVTRTLTVSSTQANGLAGGESAFNQTGVFMGEAMARFELTSATNVRVQRDRSASPATFTFSVVQIEP